MRRLRWLCVCVALLTSLRVQAVEAVVSFAVFQQPGREGDSSFIEIYWHINPGSLHYRKSENGDLSARVATALQLYDENGIVQEEKYLLNTKPLPPGLAAAQRIIELQRYYLPRGTFYLDLRLSEPDFPAGSFMFHDSVVNAIRPMPCYSTLQLLDTFYNSTVPGPFLKNGRHQIPRSLNFLDDGQLLHYYTELYHTEAAGKDAFPLVQQVFITKKIEGDPYLRLKHFDTLRTGSPKTTFVHTISPATLPSGNYYLHTELKDRSGRLLAANTAFFQCINKHPVEAAAPAGSDTGTKMETYTFVDLNKTFVAKFTAAQLRAILKMINPIADPVEAAAITGFLKRPDEVYTRYFILNFFTKRNAKQPEQAWKEFSGLVREVNKQFSSGSTMGYETDRGIIYLKYGKPDERLTVPNEPGALPYEVWRYNVLGRSGMDGTFLFYQPGYIGGDYKLLHTTVTGELRNAAWRSVLYSTGQSSGNNNSRAEQYIGNR